MYAKDHGFYDEKDCPYIDPAKNPQWYYADNEQREVMRQKALAEIPNLADKSALSLRATIIERKLDDFGIGANLDYLREKIRANKPVGMTLVIAGNEWRHGSILKIPNEDEIKKSCPNNSLSMPEKQCAVHAVIVTGYDDARRVFYFKNSWDNHWGVNHEYLPRTPYEPSIGYGVVSYEYFARFSTGKLLSLE
jgi:hypothetical protein